jgi:hypothetical protein
MPSWKKVITSGSAGSLSSLSLDTALPVSEGGTGVTTLTSNGILTGNGTSAIQAESNLTFNAANGNFSSGDGSESVTHEPASNYLTVHETGATKGSHLRLATDNSDFFLTAAGGSNQLSLYDANAAANRLIVTSAGTFQFQQDVSVPVTNKIYLDGGGDSYIYTTTESSNNNISFVIGGNTRVKMLPHIMYINSTGANGLVINNDEGTTTNSGRIFFEGNTTTALMQELDDFSIRTGATAGSSSGTERFRVNTSGASVTGDLDVSGALTLGTALAVAEGGTGATSLTSNAILTGNGTSAIQAESGLTFDGTLLHISKETSTTGTTGTTFLKLTNDVGIDLSQQKTFIDFAFLDDNTNETPQVRIGAEVGQNGDANSQEKEGSGAFVVYTNDADTTSGDAGASLAERMRVDYQGNLSATGDVIAYYSSDKRLKDNIVRIENPLEKVGKIGGYEFDWNDKQKTYEGHDIGVIAQEIQEVLPELVTERDNGYLAVKYEKIVPLLIESIKELKQEVDEIKQKCDCLNN